MKCGISQLILGKLSCEEFLNTSSRAGYDVVELTLRQEGEICPQMGEDAVQRIKSLATKAGVDLVSMVFSHCTGNLLDHGEAQKRSVQETIEGIKLCSAMGIGCALHTLGRLRNDLYYEDAFNNAVASLKQIAPEAEKSRVTLAIEFVWNGFLFSPLEMRSLIDEVGSDAVGFYFDPGNMAVFQPPQHWVRALGSRTKMVHMKDWRGGPLQGEWTALLKGEVDFPTVMAELQNAGYTGPFISEVDPALASIEETAETIKQIAKM